MASQMTYIQNHVLRGSTAHRNIEARSPQN
jgi:hypothetical protein